MANIQSTASAPSKARRFFVGLGSVLLMTSALPAWGWSQGWDWEEDFTGPVPGPELEVDCSLDAAPDCAELWS